MRRSLRRGGETIHLTVAPHHKRRLRGGDTLAAALASVLQRLQRSQTGGET